MEEYGSGVRGFIEKFDEASYEITKLAMMVVVVVSYPVSFVTVFWSLGHFIRLEVIEGLKVLAIFVASLILMRGSLKILHKLDK